jgi:hypothetical protein
MGIGIAVVLFGVYLVITYEFPSVPLWSATVRLLVGACAAVLVADYVMKRRRLQKWPSTLGRIEYCCKLGEPHEGSQEYSCAYTFSVDGVRQGGEIRFSNKPGRLEEIKAALVGKQITVRYDARDCTKSMLEQTSIQGWKLR